MDNRTQRKFVATSGVIISRSNDAGWKGILIGDSEWNIFPRERIIKSLAAVAASLAAIKLLELSKLWH